MRLRLARQPWGVARFAYSYLAGVAAAAITGAIGGILFTALAYAPSFWATWLTIAVLIGSVVLVTYVFRLGWLWGAWLIAVLAVLAQIVLEANWLNGLWAVFAAPGLAAAITFRRRNAPVSKPVRVLRLAALGVVYAQFLVWVIIWLATPS